MVSPIDDTPAFRAGLEPGDLITHIDDEAVLGLTLGQAVDRMRGPVDAPITVTVRREGEAPFDVTIVRAVIRIQSVRRRAEGDIGYIRITSFNGNTLTGLENAVSRLKDEIGGGLKGYVVDLRNNPGGLLEQAISVSDAFLERGEIVSTRGRDEESAQRFNAKPGDIAGGLPLVVLINEGSASASRDRGRRAPGPPPRGRHGHGLVRQGVGAVHDPDYRPWCAETDDGAVLHARPGHRYRARASSPTSRSSRRCCRRWRAGAGFARRICAAPSTRSRRPSPGTKRSRRSVPTTS